MTSSQAAELLGVSQSRIRQLAITGKLTAVKFGRDWQIDRASVEQYAAAHLRKGATDAE